MAEYKLIHFNTRFLAEPIRYMFAYAKVPYEDVRVSLEDWKAMKENNPAYSHLPVLELSDGRVLTQSSAIAEFLAKKFDLVPDNEFSEARCIEISDSMRDVRQDWRKYFLTRNRDRKAEMKRIFMKETIPRYFGYLNKMLETSGGDYLVDDKITWVDLLVAHTIAFIQETIDEHCFDGYPKLVEMKEKILSTPQMQKWLNERPKPDLKMLLMIPVSV